MWEEQRGVARSLLTRRHAVIGAAHALARLDAVGTGMIELYERAVSQ